MSAKGLLVDRIEIPNRYSTLGGGKIRFMSILLICVSTSSIHAKEIVVSCVAVENVLSEKKDGSATSIHRTETPLSVKYISSQNNFTEVNIRSYTANVSTGCLLKKYENDNPVVVPVVKISIFEQDHNGGATGSQGWHSLSSFYGYTNKLKYIPTSSSEDEIGQTHVLGISCFWDEDAPDDCNGFSVDPNLF